MVVAQLLFLFLQILQIVYGNGVLELDAHTFWEAVNKGTDQDLLVIFPKSFEQVTSVSSLAHTLSRKLKLKDGPSSSFIIGIYDVVKRGGFPSGVHVHSHDSFQTDIILWPAGGREPSLYDWTHDPLSVFPSRVVEKGEKADSKCSAGTCGTEDEHSEHHHALDPSAIGVLRWLKKATSFPGDVPDVSLGELWEGRETDLFSAVAKGLEALQERVVELKEENLRLQRELEICQRQKN